MFRLHILDLEHTRFMQICALFCSLAWQCKSGYPIKNPLFFEFHMLTINVLYGWLLSSLLASIIWNETLGLWTHSSLKCTAKLLEKRLVCCTQCSFAYQTLNLDFMLWLKRSLSYSLHVADTRFAEHFGNGYEMGQGDSFPTSFSSNVL